MPLDRKSGRLLIAGIAFGVLVAVVKGQGAGLRDALGNTSAPWVLLPFLAGTRFSRVPHAAAAGLATTMAAFLGFYTAEAAILDLGPHPWYVDLELTLGSGHVYEVWGMVSGLLYGALGGVWASRSRLAAGAVALAFICEPLIVALLVRTGLWGGDLLQYPLIWVTEVLLGLAGGAVVFGRLAARPAARR
jgi:hypothetical protein